MKTCAIQNWHTKMTSVCKEWHMLWHRKMSMVCNINWEISESIHFNTLLEGNMIQPCPLTNSG